METNCKVCGEVMILRPAGISYKKDPKGKPYNAFMACPKGCKSPVNNNKPQNSDEHIKVMNFMAEEFANLNRRMDGLAQYLMEHFKDGSLPKEPVKNEVNIKDIPY